MRRDAAVDTPEKVYRALAPRLRGEGREVFMAVALDVRHRPIADPIVVAVGHLGGVDVHPREVFRPLVRLGAARFIVAHNHPSSGDPEPSPQDVALTERLQKASQVVGIPIADHVIIGDGRWVSLRERGVIV